MTQLLVSVRNAVEAIAAAEGGADIIDVKEPYHGSLGCASPEVILAIADAAKCLKGVKPPLSLALGELKEWQTGDLTSLRNAIHTAAPQFLKLGLAQACEVPGAGSWVAKWQQTRSTLLGAHEWVAVAYADHRQAGSPAVDSVLRAASESGCRILLLDTYTKNGTSLLDHVALDALQAIRQQTHQHGLKLALAGSVAISDLPRLLRVHPDIIAVRGAVCAHGDRTATVSKSLVQDFRAAISYEDRSDGSG